MLIFPLWNSAMSWITLSKAYDFLFDFNNPFHISPSHTHFLSVPGRYQTFLCLVLTLFSQLLLFLGSHLPPDSSLWRAHLSRLIFNFFADKVFFGLPSEVIGLSYVLAHGSLLICSMYYQSDGFASFCILFPYTVNCAKSAMCLSCLALHLRT